jgi:hypothetical protein
MDIRKYLAKPNEALDVSQNILKYFPEPFVSFGFHPGTIVVPGQMKFQKSSKSSTSLGCIEGGAP